LHEFHADKEMASFVQVYVDAIRHEAMVEGVILMVEQQVTYDSFDPGGFGTLDACIYNPALKHLGIDDLKYGIGVKVNAKDNESLLSYAAAWIDTFSDIVGEVDQVTVRIHQPRLHHYDEYTYAAEEVLQHGRMLKGAMEICRDYDAPRVPGTKQCTFCRARHTCVEYAEWQLSTVAAPHMSADLEASGERLIDNINAITPPALDTLTNSFIANLLPRLDGFVRWANSVKAFALDELKRGNKIGGYKLVYGRSSRVWKDDMAVAKKLKGMRFKQDQVFERKLISVAQCEKLVDKKRFDKLSNLIEKKDGNLTLAPVTDKRPAVIVGNIFDDLDA
jgi:hypothetical protein